MDNSISSMGFSGITRMSGLASGIDTDSLVKQLMNAEKIPLNKLYQKKQTLTWKRDAYRDMTNLLRGFNDDFFNVLKPTANMISPSTTKKFLTTTSDNTIVNATANADASVGTHTITVNQFASAATTSTTLTGSGAASLNYTVNNQFNLTLDGVTKTINLRNASVYASNSELIKNSAGDGIQQLVDAAFGSGKIGVSIDGAGILSFATTGKLQITSGVSDALPNLKFASGANNSATVTKSLTGTAGATLVHDGTNNQFNITLDGVTKTISLRNGAYLLGDLVSNTSGDGIQQLVDNAFGSGKINVSADGAGVLTFSSAKGQITLNSAATNDGLGTLKFTNGASNRLNTGDTLANLAAKFNTPLTFSGTALNFTLNGVYFSVDSSTTLQGLMDKINNSTAGVQLQYNKLTDLFTISSKNKGAGDNIIISNSGGNLFGSGSAINIASSIVNNGQDAVFDLDGTTGLKRNDNVFTISGVTYTLSSNGKTLPQTVNIGVTQDVDGIVTNIKNFVNKYNDVIQQINDKINEDHDSKYPPLTDDQKASMKAEDIKAWEDKAKKGLLKDDGILENIVFSMRKALTDSIQGVSGTLSDIGISTANYMDQGKLVIDETKLRNAIQTDPNKVQNLFSRDSGIAYSPSLNVSDRYVRYNNEGIANRIFDILQNNIRTARDSSNRKGILLEKAGVVGDASEFLNLMNTDINATDTDISDMNKHLKTVEDNYYKKFTAMEKAIEQANSQSSWLQQQLGGMSGK